MERLNLEINTLMNYIKIVVVVMVLMVLELLLGSGLLVFSQVRDVLELSLQDLWLYGYLLGSFIFNVVIVMTFLWEEME